jgi:hypothetical protein
MYRGSLGARSVIEVKTPQTIPPRSILAKRNSTWLSHDE